MKLITKIIKLTLHRKRLVATTKIKNPVVITVYKN